jgi:hypothetical protein
MSLKKEKEEDGRKEARTNAKRLFHQNSCSKERGRKEKGRLSWE